MKWAPERWGRQGGDHHHNRHATAGDQDISADQLGPARWNTEAACTSACLALDQGEKEAAAGEQVGGGGFEGPRLLFLATLDGGGIRDAPVDPFRLPGKTGQVSPARSQTATT